MKYNKTKKLIIHYKQMIKIIKPDNQEKSIFSQELNLQMI